MYSSLLEMSYSQLAAKQQNIVNLFPTFRDRVKKVANNGGVTLSKKENALWTFTVQSGDEKRHAAGITYTVRIYFAEVENAIESGAKERGNWTKDGQHLNLNKLGQWVIMHADLGVSSTSPGDQFWGPNYQRTRAGAELDHEENRPPVIRNPNEFGIMGKHLQLVFDVLPFYAGTMATELKKYYRDFIVGIEADMLKKRFKSPKATPKAVQKPEEKPAPGTQGRNLKLTPKEEQDEEEFKNPEEDSE